MPVEMMDRTVAIRLTPTQAALFQACAEREGTRLSTWIRRAAQRRASEIAVEMEETVSAE